MFKRCLRWFPQHELFLVTEERFRCLRFTLTCSPSSKIDEFQFCSKLQKCVNLWRVSLWRGTVFGDLFTLKVYSSSMSRERKICQCECLANVKNKSLLSIYSNVNLLTVFVYDLLGVYFSIFSHNTKNPNLKQLIYDDCKLTNGLVVRNCGMFWQ